MIVLIATHSRPTLLETTLRSVAACDRPGNYQGALVVENGPSAGARAVVASVSADHPGARFRYLHHARANKSAALNAALVGVPDETLCVMFDDDIRVEPGTLAAYAAVAKVHGPGEAYFGGPFGCDYEEAPPGWIRPLLPPSARGWEGEPGVMHGIFLGSNWAAYAGDLRAAGGFDPNFGPGSPTGATGQESRMQSALQENGLVPQFVRGSRVWHYVPKRRSSLRWAARREYRAGVEQGQKIGPGREREFAWWRRSTRQNALSLVKRLALADPRGAATALVRLGKCYGFWTTYARRRFV